MPKENLKDKLDGNELDLGLSNLTTVPVKELAALPKATVLDLSNNIIATLPDSFCTLTHLVKIDLSKNLLTELPDNFGALRNLQHLDLLGNKLTMLPVSFWKLEKLKWLDLKDNPLKDDLKKLAGDCLNETQCKRCAQMILRYMKDFNSELERIKQKRLQKERELEALQNEKEEEERRKLREERKAEKERKKQENRLKYQNQREDEKTSSEEGEELERDEKDVPVKVKKGKGSSACTKIILSLFIMAIIIIGIMYVIKVYCDQEKGDQFCKEYGHTIIRETEYFLSDMEKRLHLVYSFIQKKFK